MGTGRRAPDFLAVVCLVKNGQAYIENFIKHYRDLGAETIAFMDNGSTDGTLEALARHADVSVVATDMPYRTHKVAIKDYLVRQFDGGGWVIVVDIDELWDYPFRDRMSLRAFLQYLNRHKYTAVAAHMLDMFPNESLLTFSGDWREAHRDSQPGSCREARLRDPLSGI